MSVTVQDIERKIHSGEYATVMAAVCGITRMKGVPDSEKTRLKDLARQNISVVMAPRKRKDGSVPEPKATTSAIALYEPARARKGKDPRVQRDVLLGQLQEVEKRIAAEEAVHAQKSFMLHMDSLMARAKEEVREDWETVSKAKRETLFEIARQLLASIEEDPSSPEVASRLIGVVCATLDAAA